MDGAARRGWWVLVGVAALCALAACASSEEPAGSSPCDGDADCADGLICLDGRCIAHGCQHDWDCPWGRSCDPETGRCLSGDADAVVAADVDIDTDTDTDADTDSESEDDCGWWEPCETDADCDWREWCEQGCCYFHCNCEIDAHCSMLGENYVCVLCFCEEDTCSSDADCAPGKVCLAGECTERLDCSTVATIRVTSPPGAIRTGVARQLRAQAIDRQGHTVPGMRFRWTSSDPDVASVDADTGVVTGGEVEGPVEITAELACDEHWTR